MESNKRIVNLSSFKLREEHFSLLNRGLKFCPTPGRPDVGLLGEDMLNLHRRLRQIAFFDHPGSDPDLTSFVTNADPDNLLGSGPFEHRKFKVPSAGKGPPGPPNLEVMISINELEFNSRPPYTKNYRDNLSPKERRALKELSSQNDVILRPADKGAATVLWSRQLYLEEGYRQLADASFYKKLVSDPTDSFRIKVQNFIEDLFQNGEIKETVKQYLTDLSCRTSELYLLPKIHKNKHPPPGRPIISANGCPTEKISQFVDHFLNPAMKNLTSFVKDTTHFLRILSDIKDLPPHTLLVTLDVESLYTNIPLDFGLRAAKIALDKTRPLPSVKPSNLNILKLLRMVLTMNNFRFNGQHFIQINGTAMGTKAAVAFAVVALGLFEELYVYTYHTQPRIFLRYIDDIFLCWTEGREKLDQFIKHLNDAMDCFNFTKEISSTSVNFLDTTISFENGCLESNLYTKPTDSHNYLRYDSAHPQRCKDSIPYSQFLRIRRICSKPADFATHVLAFKTFFLDRNYPDTLLEEAIRLASSKDRSLLLHPKEEEIKDEDRVFLITTYHPHDRFLNDLIYKNWSILGKNHTTEFIHNRKLMCGYRRPKNLRDNLVRARVAPIKGDWAFDPTYTPDTPDQKPVAPATVAPPTPLGAKLSQRSIKDFFLPRPGTPVQSLTNVIPSTSNALGTSDAPRKFIHASKFRGYSFCNTRGCRFCPNLNKTGLIKSNHTGETFNSMRNISCRSSNLIYSITCKVCGIQYVGQTKLRVRDRFSKHFYNVQNSDPDTSVGRHFSQRSHRGTKDMEIHVLEFIKKPPRSPQAVSIRLRRESTWTHLLRSLAPLGLNMETPKEYKSYSKKK